jgi:hypothetical protein
VDQRPDPGRLTGGEAGFATLQNVMAAGIAMVFFAIMANLVVMQYTVGVITAALDDGVRQGARAIDPVGSCQAGVADTLGLAGRSLSLASARCSTAGGWVVAEASATLVAWAPLVPDITVERDARAPLEQLVP